MNYFMSLCLGLVLISIDTIQKKLFNIKAHLILFIRDQDLILK